MRTFLLMTIIVLLVQTQFAFAKRYDVDVTRKGSNLYNITGQDLYVHTQYCYEYVYYESSILIMNGFSGEIIFGKNYGKDSKRNFIL